MPELVEGRVSARLIEFIGDSITAGALTDRLALDSYAWKAGGQPGARNACATSSSWETRRAKYVRKGEQFDPGEAARGLFVE
ncbi:hypothetical protein [Streptomyces sp. NBC_01334]|uniref:hypothetical protein n=1 Tax=Streptomyces sp. NBC_01334 TaxID=2903827 RepID=UPI002E14C385|nr:hypothetical protein OG736_05775 [Streptomyces sp. NBC_01334]